MALLDNICLACRSCMEDMPYIIRPGKNVYSAETYVGNWYEETCRNTVKRDEFLRKRECGDLKIQRTQTMVDLLLKPIPLSQQMDGYLHYGDVVQIVSPGPSCYTALEEHPFKRGHCRLGHLALSSSVPPSMVDHTPYLSTDSIMSASPLLFPVVRNSYVIEDAACPLTTGGVVHYGDIFRIRTLPTQHFTLYLFSSPAIRLHVGSTHSAQPKVRLSDVKTYDTLWSAWPIDSFERLKMDLGLPIPLKKRLYIKHHGTGINLSTEPNFPVLTYFGQELEVTTDTKLDRVKRPTYANIWYFDTERGRPKPDECKKQFMEQSAVDAAWNARMVDKSAAEEEKLKEEAKKAAEPEPDDDEDESEDPSYVVEQKITEFDPKKFRESLRKIDEPKEFNAGGQLPFDPATGPQPNAYTYRVFKDDPHFPNRKYSCGQTDCCNKRPLPPLITEQKPAECCECVEYPDPLPNPNVRLQFLKPLIR